MKINNHVIKVKGLKNEYHFMQITDLHMMLLDDAFSSEKRNVYAKREQILFDRNGTTPEEKLTKMMDYCAECDLFPIFSGDIFDFPSKSNFHYFDKELKKVNDYFFILGNHEWTYMDKYNGLIDYDDYRSKEAFDKYYHLFDKYIKDGSLEVQKREFDDLIIFGLDGHDGDINEEQVNYFEELIKLNKPILVVCHIPYYEIVMQKTFDDFAPGYLKKVAFGQEQLPMGPNEKRFRNLLMDPNSHVIAYLCGHAHCTVDCKIGGVVPQYLLGGSYEDEVNVFTLIPGE